MAKIFRKYDNLLEYQLIQENMMHFTLKLESVRGMYTDDDFKDTIRNLVGSDVFVAIEHVDKIPHLSSGKFKKVICNYKVDS